MHRKALKKILLQLVLVTGIAGCASSPPPLPEQPALPDNWRYQHSSPGALDGWIDQFDDQQLTMLIDEAMKNNHALKATAQRIAQASASLDSTTAALYPSLDLSLGSDRSRSSSGSISSSSRADLDLQWDADIWGKLEDAEQEASLTLAARVAEYDNQRQQLASDIGERWYELQAAQMLLNLYIQRRLNLQQNLDLIESRYRQGLNDALDVYLARNDVRSEDARISEQHQTLQETGRALERLLGRYPAAQLSAPARLPIIDSEPAIGLPSGLVKRHPLVLQRWLELLASDAALAQAHKSRFPSLKLSTSAGQRSNQLSDLISRGNLVWSLGLSLSQNLFDAGDLEARQNRQLAERRELEQQYLDQLFDQFSDVENALSNRTALKQQYDFYLEAQSNATAAEVLAFEQYARGIVNYTTVLEAQRRAFDAQTRVIEVRKQLLQNRINLYRALGSRYRPDINLAANSNEITEKSPEQVSNNTL